MINKIHIISFNIPYPPNYGGVIDVFYKIKALHSLGVKIHLHCYQYGRDISSELDEYCEKVYYYPRKNFFKSIYSHVPYIVGSRSSDDLMSNLLEDDNPILFEGLHTCANLGHPHLKDRIKIVRMHNVEWDYYKSLGKAEQNFFRKFYFYTESFKLKHFENILNNANHILSISPNDTEYLQEKYSNAAYVTAFHSNENVNINTGIGDYALYHGNLGVIENNQAAFYLIEKVFKKIDYPLKIAGKKPLDSLFKLVNKYDHIELIPDPDFPQMLELIKNAHINVLPTFQPTGIKLKLINALYNGRFCIVNNAMVENTGLQDLCIQVEDAKSTISQIENFKDQPFTSKDIELRKKVLYQGFSNLENAKKIINLIKSTELIDTKS
ncbi:MAG: hypothetical protein EA412_14000 [Chitinophagaceae bacterium]|nr:MAG: hypothetical protein EA412_14000 [Chitinophagaceae bacterium]